MGYDGVELRFLEGDDALWARPELTGSGLAETLARLPTPASPSPASIRAASSTSPEPAARRRAVDEADARWSLRRAGRSRHSRLRRCRAAGRGSRLDASLHRRFAERARERLRARASRSGSSRTATSLPGSATRALLDHAGSEGLGVVWDPANAFEAFGEAPEDGFTALGASLRHVHLKDLRRPRDGIPWPPVLPGSGEFPAARILELAAASGTPAGSRSSGRSAGIPRSRTRRWRCRTSCTGPRAGCGGDARTEAGRAVPTLRPPGRGGPLDRPAMGRAAARASPRLSGLVDARGAGRRHLRFRALAERVPDRVAPSARHPLGESRPSTSTSTWAWPPTIPPRSGASSSTACSIT